MSHDASPSPAAARPLPKLADLGLDLLHVGPARRALTLAVPFACSAAYFVFASRGWWWPAVLSLVYLTFITYASISHDLVHRNLGLRRNTNEALLSLIELLAIRSGHAYRLAHLHHHRRFPHDDDIEGAASKMPFWRTFVDGVTLQPRIYRWAWQQARDEGGRASRERAWLLAEGACCVGAVAAALAVAPRSVVPAVYVGLMVLGSWVFPLATAYIPHDPHGADALHQTRLFRGRVASLVAMEHLYHLEHHLYPAVPHHNWAKLAKRLDPYFERAGIKPIKLWF